MGSRTHLVSNLIDDTPGNIYATLLKIYATLSLRHLAGSWTHLVSNLKYDTPGFFYGTP
jgi:hypothetical protein